jgi:DNA gyrase/topoisomerase IV subunit B
LGNWHILLLMMVFIFFLLKEVLNCIDEFVMGAGKTIEVSIKDVKKKQLL